MVYSLSLQKNAPKTLSRLSQSGIPYMAILFSLFFIFITVILNYLYPQRVFNILLAIATIAAMINWITILVTQIYFRAKVGLPDIKYKMPLYPIASIVAIIFFAIIIVTMSQMKDMSLAIYIAPIWLLILSVGYWIKTKFKNI
jgi:AAT family amino acid transporter